MHEYIFLCVLLPLVGFLVNSLLSLLDFTAPQLTANRTANIAAGAHDLHGDSHGHGDAHDDHTHDAHDGHGDSHGGHGSVPTIAGREVLVGVFATLMIAIPFFIVVGTFFELWGLVSAAGSHGGHALALLDGATHDAIQGGGHATPDASHSAATDASHGAAHPALQFIVPVYQWMKVGALSVGIAYQVDTLSILMALIVTGVGSLIHLYSIGYMHGDPGLPRFFSYLNLFIFSMLNLILADNLVLTFLGWEGVGVCSYLLIGFWYDRKFDGTEIYSTGDAAKKAFIANRVGDFAMLGAMFLIFQTLGSFTYNEILAGVAQFDSPTIFWVTLLIFIGCTGKSAQIPLFVWLPDAMAGPTPVSALIHAATMVTSGIFITARLSPLFLASPTTMEIMAIVGAVTALFAGTIGLVQNDIKKVLAYSTVSQLGFMFLALGVGAFHTAIFHVMTHAFFKACLFLGSGSVIHGMHEEQDIRKMGGLSKYMPSTSWTFFFASLALAGFPLTAGFFSKDDILAKAFASNHIALYAMGTVAALCTAFYTMRLYALTFMGNPRFDASHVHPHESSAWMTVPLWILAALSLGAGFLGLPPVVQEHNWIDGWLESSVAVAPNAHDLFHLPASTEWILLSVGAIVALVGLGAGYVIYTSRLDTAESVKTSLSGLYNVLYNKYYIDELYYALFVKPVAWISEFGFFRFDKSVIDGTVNGLGSVFMSLGGALKQWQSGIAQNYALAITFGLVVLVAVITFGR